MLQLPPKRLCANGTRKRQHGRLWQNKYYTLPMIESLPVSTAPGRKIIILLLKRSTCLVYAAHRGSCHDSYLYLSWFIFFSLYCCPTGICKLPCYLVPSSRIRLLGTSMQLLSIPLYLWRISSHVADGGSARVPHECVQPSLSRSSSKSQVSKLCQVEFFYIRRIRSIKDCLTQHATELLIHSLVISRLDYGNGLLYGVSDKLLDKLQRVQNVAARVVVKASRYDHITPILKTLHWFRFVIVPNINCCC